MIAGFTYYVMFYVRYTECYVIKFKYFRFEKGRYRSIDGLCISDTDRVARRNNPFSAYDRIFFDDIYF